MQGIQNLSQLEALGKKNDSIRKLWSKPEANKKECNITISNSMENPVIFFFITEPYCLLNCMLLPTTPLYFPCLLIPTNAYEYKPFFFFFELVPSAPLCSGYFLSLS